LEDIPSDSDSDSGFSVDSDDDTTYVTVAEQASESDNDQEAEVDVGPGGQMAINLEGEGPPNNDKPAHDTHPDDPPEVLLSVSKIRHTGRFSYIFHVFHVGFSTLGPPCTSSPPYPPSLCRIFNTSAFLYFYALWPMCSFFDTQIFCKLLQIMQNPFKLKVCVP